MATSGVTVPAFGFGIRPRGPRILPRRPHLKLYDTAEALDLCTKTGKAKFDETVEVHVRLGVDSRHADQQVRGAVVLPNGTGKKVRVAVFAKADKAQAALAC